jgi:GGDEF domain-containing protein
VSAESLDTASGSVRVTASFGVACAKGGSAADPEELVAAADHARYEAKQSTRFGAGGGARVRRC